MTEHEPLTQDDGAQTTHSELCMNHSLRMMHEPLAPNDSMIHSLRMVAHEPLTRMMEHVQLAQDDGAGTTHSG